MSDDSEMRGREEGEKGGHDPHTPTLPDSPADLHGTGERILVVEDDPKMQLLLSGQLAARGYDVRVAGDGATALRLAEEAPPDLVLLDITLPEIDGLEVCRQLRARSRVPIILVTAAERPETKMTALELGGDDYLTKPFHTGELIARIRAVLRRAAPDPAAAAPPTTVDAGDVMIDLERREVRRDNEPLRLTKTEFDLLRALATQPDKVVPYDELLRAVWGERYDDVRPLHVHVCHLRRKLETGPTGARHIIAVPGVGYRFRLTG